MIEMELIAINPPVSQMRFRSDRDAKILGQDGQLPKFRLSGLRGNDAVRLRVTTVNHDLYLVPSELKLNNGPNNPYLEFNFQKPVHDDSIEFELNVKYRKITHRKIVESLEIYEHNAIDPFDRKFAIYHKNTLTKVKKLIDFNRIRLCIEAECTVTNCNLMRTLWPPYASGIIKNTV